MAACRAVDLTINGGKSHSNPSELLPMFGRFHTSAAHRARFMSGRTCAWEDITQRMVVILFARLHFTLLCFALHCHGILAPMVSGMSRKWNCVLIGRITLRQRCFAIGIPLLLAVETLLMLIGLLVLLLQRQHTLFNIDLFCVLTSFVSSCHQCNGCIRSL